MAVFQLPRGPLVSNQKSGNLDYPDEYQRRMKQWREATRQDAISTMRLNPEVDNIPKYIEALEGRYWPKDRPRYRASFYDNRLMDARIDELSLLTDIRPVIEVRTTISDDEAAKAQANIAKNVIRYEWQRMNLDLRLVKVVDHALLSAGYWKIGANMPGSMSVIPCGIDTVLPIQPGLDLQSSSGVLYKTYKPLQYFKNIWGDKAAGLEREATAPAWAETNNTYVRPGHITEYTWNSLSPAMRYHLGVRTVRRMPYGTSPFPVVELEEYWIEDWSENDSPNEVIVKDPDLELNEHNYFYRVPPGRRLFPRKRLIIFGGDRLMYDGPSPYWHGLYPFAELTLNPHIWGPGGLSKYRNLMPIAQAINEIVAGSLDVVKRQVNPQLVTKDGAVRDTAWNKYFGDLPGAKLKLTAVAQVTDVRYIDPPVLQGSVFQILGQYLLPTFDRRSGKLNVGDLAGKRQVPGGDTIEQMRDLMQPPFRLESRYIEVFLRDAGIQAVSNIFQYYTREQRMAILGMDGQTWDDWDYNPNTMMPYSVPKEEHWKKFPVVIAQGTLHGASKVRDQITSLTLYRMGALDTKTLLTMMDIGDVDQILARLQAEAGIRQAMMAGQGGRVPRQTRSQRNGNPM